MSQPVSDGGPYWSYRQEGNIDLWVTHDWEQLFETERQAAEKHDGDKADRDENPTVIVQFDSADALGSQMQDSITEASQLAQSVTGIERTAYVGDGITAMAVRSNVPAPSTGLASFESIDEAIQWANE